MKNYYCNCSKNINDKKNRDNPKTFRQVETTSEGICVFCGYYAVSLPSNVSNLDQYMNEITKKEVEDEEFF